jgi:hypothetical protein
VKSAKDIGDTASTRPATIIRRIDLGVILSADQ